MGLDDYSLNIRELAALGECSVDLQAEFEVRSELDNPWTRRLVRQHPPRTRKVLLDGWYRTAYRELAKRWPSSVLEPIGRPRSPRGIRSRVAACDVPKLLRLPYLRYVWIDRIRGVRKKAKTRDPWLYAVQVRFAIQVEGQIKGQQEYEERVLLVCALDERSAERRARKALAYHAMPYLNPYGELVRWHLEKVLEVRRMSDSQFDPRGTEAWWRFGSRRMKLDYEWHPLRKKGRGVRQ